MKHAYLSILILFVVGLSPENNLHGPLPAPADNTDGIRIGKQRWATKNLATTVFETGAAIPQAKTAEEWEKAGKEGLPAWCYYSNDPNHEDQFGKLYNYYAITDPRGLAPEGWRIPTDADWKELIDFLGGEKEAGYRMKAKTGWQENKADNICGFTATPSGRREGNGTFNQMHQFAYLWSASDAGSMARALLASYDTKEVRFVQGDKMSGYAVRCLIELE